ncbi:MAG: LppX_LprAFG lipoprotein [Actinomycetota bacterium]
MKRLFTCLVTAALLAAGCTPEKEPPANAPEGPDAKAILKQSAEAMGTVPSVSFNIVIDGELAGFQIKQTNGVVTANREVQAVADIVQRGGQLVQYDFISVNEIAYLKAGPTSEFVLLNEQLAEALYDPAGLLKGDKSLPVGLAKAETAEVVGEENIAGVDCYVVKLTVPQEVVDGLAFLATGEVQEATAWIAKDTGYLVKGTLPFTNGNPAGSTINATFSDFGKEVSITAPVL